MLGMINAAPIPINPRQAIKVLALVITLHSAAPEANITSPISSAPLRPYLSPMAPAGSNSAANTKA